MSGTEVTVHGLHVRYADVHALRGVDLTVPPGHLVAVLGPSGAGKSTLLWSVAGAVRPHEGEVKVGGQAIVSRAAALEQGVVLIPQGNGLAGMLTALENITVPLVSQGVPGDQARERALVALESVGLEESWNHLIEELSGGQQQRVAVARAIAAPSNVILADEPASDLDAVNRERVSTLLRDRADAGAAVLMTTHDPEVSAVADAVLHLDEGLFTG